MELILHLINSLKISMFGGLAEIFPDLKIVYVRSKDTVER
jgi:hypothetical protein